MTFDPTKSVRQGNDRPARIVCTDMKSGYPIAAVITDKNGFEQPIAFDECGRKHSCCEDWDDLVNIPARKSWWQNVYASGNGGFYPSRQMSNSERRSDRLAVVEYLVEDGKIVDVKLHKLEDAE